MPRGEAEHKARELSALAQLPEVNLTRYPSQLSGGQRQRVALVRALMGNPDLLLLDEPLGALDPIVRYELQDELKDLFARLGITVVLVTHDMDEATHFAHKIAVMREGRVVQFDSPERLRSHPADDFVEMFFRAGRRGAAQGAGS
jgi:osmoprotectant transport system ATP-binding protein